MEIEFYRNKPFKTLLSLYKGNYLRIILSFICFIIKHSPVWVLPIVTANMINAITASGGSDVRAIWQNGFVMLLLILINIPANLLCVRYVSLATRSVETNIRMSLVKKLQVLSIPYHKHLQAGRLQSKVLRDVEAITILSRQFCNSILPIIVNLVVAFSVTISRSISVALFFVATLPVAFIVVSLFRGKIRRSNTRLRKDIEDMSATVAQMVEMVPLARAHALENIEIQKVDEKVQEVRKSGYEVDVLNAFFGSNAWATLQILQIICLVFTGYLAVKGDIQVGDIVLYQSYFSTIMNQVSSVINIYPEIVKGFESINSVGEIILAGDVEEHKGKPKVKQVEGNFEFQEVAFKYEEKGTFVLKDFNLKVKAGECIAFVGKSGGGKTTLLNLLIGFMKPSLGKLLLDGKDMQEIDLQSYRKQIAVVPQNTILFSGTIRENITYGLEVKEAYLEEILEAACLKEVIEKLPNGLETNIGEHGDLLSGGQRQRIAIARALIRDPKVIILDEATSALDNASEVHVQQAMKNLTKGRTTFIVAHRLSTITDADRIIVIKEGRCVEEGSYENLLARKGVFYELTRLQRETIS